MIVYGRNPVREALRGRRRVQRVFATKRTAQEVWLGGVETVVAEAYEFARNSPWPDPATATDFVFSASVTPAAQR